MVHKRGRDWAEWVGLSSRGESERALADEVTA